MLVKNSIKAGVRGSPPAPWTSNPSREEGGHPRNSNKVEVSDEGLPGRNDGKYIQDSTAQDFFLNIKKRAPCF
jgi:hypothetical protein